jgi:hypothetical protein
MERHTSDRKSMPSKVSHQMAMANAPNTLHAAATVVNNPLVGVFTALVAWVGLNPPWV